MDPEEARQNPPSSSVSSSPARPVLSLQGAALRLGGRVIWHDLDLDVQPGEFLAVLGSNGSGKTSLLRVVLGQHELAAGTGEVFGAPFTRGNPRIGYVPQQKLADRELPLRGRDLVALGVSGTHWGIGLPSRSRRANVDELLRAVGADQFGSTPLGLLSGGEQQRLRLAQALAGDPRLVLCDEPLLSLDLRRQAEVTDLLDRQRRARGFAVMFVTHDVNPVLPYVDRVLYLADGRFRIGTPDEVLRSDVLSELYRSQVEVVHAAGRIIVAGAPEHPHHDTPAKAST